MLFCDFIWEVILPSTGINSSGPALLMVPMDFQECLKSHFKPTGGSRGTSLSLDELPRIRAYHRVGRLCM